MEDESTVLEQVFENLPMQFRQLNEYEAKAMLSKLGNNGPFIKKLELFRVDRRKELHLQRR